MTKRIHIIGGPASGKSTLARRLGAELQLPVIELDKLFWDDESPYYAHRRDEVERDRLLTSHLFTDSWIVEGVYWKWCLPSFERADKIILLDAPHWVRQWRLASRFIKRNLGIEKSIKKDSLIKGYLETARWNSHWDRDNLPKIKEVLIRFQTKTEIRCA